jgi:hypothetical protein
MGTSLILTNSLYLEATGLGSSNSSNVPYTISSQDSIDKRIYGISVTNTSPVNHLGCTLWLSDGTANYQMGKIDIPANSGNSISIAATDIFTSSTFNNILTYSMCDNMGVYYFNVPKSWSMKISYTNTLSAGQTMSIVCFGEKYGGNTTKHTSSPFSQVTSVTAATGTSTVTLLSSSSKDRRIYSINASSTDTTARTMTFFINNGSTSYQIYTESILANSGNATTIGTEDLFYDSLVQGLFVRCADSEGLSYYFNLPSGWSIIGRLAVATSGSINIQIRGEEYG